MTEARVLVDRVDQRVEAVPTTEAFLCSRSYRSAAGIMRARAWSVATALHHEGAISRSTGPSHSSPALLPAGTKGGWVYDLERLYNGTSYSIDRDDGAGRSGTTSIPSRC